MDKAKKKILVADSHETSLHVITIMLHKLGYNAVLEAVDISGVEKLISENTRTDSGMSGLLGKAAPSEVCDIDLLILDYSLDSDCGMSFLSSLRKKFTPDQLPVLFMAMKDSECDLDAASTAGANDTVEKPFPQFRLSAKISGLLRCEKAPVIQSFSFGAGKGNGSNKDNEKPKQSVKAQEPEAIAKEPEAIKVESTPKAQKTAASNATKPKSTGGVSFYRAGSTPKTFSTDGEPTATLIDGKIDGHYHEEVDVIGGGVNCYWATSIDGSDLVKLDYLTPAGKRTSMEAKKIPKEQFMYTFYLCDEHGCPIMEKLKKQNAQ